MLLQLVLFTLDWVCASVALVLVGLLWFGDKRNYQVKGLVAMGITTSIWILFDATAMVSRPEAYEYMYTMRSVMLAVTPYYFLAFMLSLNRSKWLENKPFMWVITLLPTVDILLILTNPLHSLIFAEPGFPLPVYGPLFLLHALVAYAPVALGLCFLIRFQVVEKPARWFTLTSLSACFLALLVNILFTGGILQLPQDVAPLGFFVMFVVFAVFVFRARLNRFRATALTDIFRYYKDAVFIINDGGILSDVNDAARRFFPGLQMEPDHTTALQLIAYLRQIAAPDTDPAVFDRIPMRDTPYPGGEFSTRTTDGDARTFVINRQDVVSQRRLSGGILILSDVTPYRQMIQEINEQNARLLELKDMAESASEAKSTFLATMSHEMRTPLNAILGLGEIELKKSLPPETLENLQKIYGSGRTLLSVINDILDISKIESGQLELVPHVYDVPSMIYDTISINRVRIQDKPIAFLLELDPQLPSRLVGDELRVKQIFNNLLSNAFKFTRKGEVRLRIGFEKRDDDHILLQIAVRDTGPGIREADLQGLFGDYHQVDVRMNRNIEGTGLGLAITRRLAEQMQGTASVESTYGAGSTFHVAVMQAIGDSTPIGQKTVESLQSFRHVQEQHPQDAAEMAQFPGAHVLVVDDLQINLDVAQAILEMHGLTVATSLSGADAVARMKAGAPRFDLVFMDHMMPGMDGVEATRKIRALSGDYAHNIPIVALTANALSGNEEMFLRSGFQGFLPKPIDMAKMQVLLTQFLSQKEQCKK